ncbi:hypothetical protein J45TS6_35670 [Paenibacillus sp. J45TS6]|uniref:DUF3139 domain-containing protein n=1 Tax=Paenibacillus gallinarum TaxID=2762232 RepID=A0ABR8T657_9BACL|nr:MULTISPECIES: DUF3139 domain-containing protein [Paenibacillus]MBD7971261.1 DUF3139 domain-containing protein [Paenibacillus gallinarum]GIP45108.1 hypothetical protein J45TS6_35670 [Paenibacillus sp. J45TS6]
MKKLGLISAWTIFGLVCIAIGFVVFTLYSLNTPPKSDPEIVAYNEERVMKYLIEDKGYSESDIASIEAKKMPKSSGYETFVEFSDELDKLYAYKLEEDGEIKQNGSTGGAYKHKE